jgi:uncharacterized protein with PQ loop repeat
MYEAIGYIAIFVASSSLIPQMHQMIKTKKVKDLNIYFLFLILLADILYFIYGILDNNTILFASTIPPTISHIIVILLWYYYKNLCCFKYLCKNKNILNDNDCSQNDNDCSQNDIEINRIML